MPSRPNKGQWYAIRLIFNNRLYPCHSVCTRLSPLLSRLPAQVPEGKGVNFPVTLYTSLRGRNPPWKGVNYGNGNKKNSEPWVLHRSRILTGGGGSPLPEVSTADGNCSCSTAISNEMSWDERLNVEVSVLEVDIADGDLSHKRPSDLFAARMAVALGNKTGWNLLDFFAVLETSDLEDGGKLLIIPPLEKIRQTQIQLPIRKRSQLVIYRPYIEIN